MCFEKNQRGAHAMWHSTLFFWETCVDMLFWLEFQNNNVKPGTRKPASFTWILYVKIWNHPIETTNEKWLFGVPRTNYLFSTLTARKPLDHLAFAWIHLIYSMKKGRSLRGFPAFVATLEGFPHEILSKKRNKYILSWHFQNINVFFSGARLQ